MLIGMPSRFTDTSVPWSASKPRRKSWSALPPPWCCASTSPGTTRRMSSGVARRLERGLVEAVAGRTEHFRLADRAAGIDDHLHQHGGRQAGLLRLGGIDEFGLLQEAGRGEAGVLGAGHFARRRFVRLVSKA